MPIKIDAIAQNKQLFLTKIKGQKNTTKPNRNIMNVYWMDRFKRISRYIPKIN